MSYHQPFPDPPPTPGAWKPVTHPWDAPPPQREDPLEPHSPHGDLAALRSGYRRLRRVATLTALGYFTLFLLLAAFAPGLMTSRISGGLNTGLLLGLCQLPVALAAIALYERIARSRIDPLTASIREHTGRAPQETRTARPRGGPWAEAPGRPLGRGQSQWPGAPTGGARS
ncbi:DUF485 domain-containing protein [Streptomyces sp. TRM49041]|uniref:DUF485 domain-containing protein n=1 Tax=Streptomyces sp. TRM49041 TaxID=2603216 RepID=UPI0011F055E4|nr:DUF485 domain-containing protein [Streptomyces sp. TRM49041]